ncbi:MAG: hypothetical protein KU38_07590 [Sulfurovum sp. FS08-3]|nr:MAG: hypothetical protein KU38_07590 [Sulfurovum sp. FS08-3]
MRYIQKVQPPQFFIEDTLNLESWSSYFSHKKHKLKEHLLEHEQNYLCCYCESKISSDTNSSHVEHIRPKGHDKYPHLTFEYHNLAVSCNGTCQNLPNDSTIHNCGHIKSNEYDENLFLNPVELEDIRDYFEYDIDEGKIEASAKNEQKASYMIDTLRLNDGGLTKAREKALENFIEKMKKIEANLRREEIKKILKEEKLEQISFFEI